MNVQIEESWKQHIGAEFEKPYFSELVNFVRQEYSTTTCYPPGREIFNAFNLCPYDLGTDMPRSGSLRRWAEQGVLLLNATLTVRAHQAASHQRRGWEEFTDAVIQAVARDKEHVVYMLWGGFAKSKARIVNPQRNLVLQSAHPSPLSANRGGWFGNHHFSLCNDYLVKTGQTPIQW